MNLRNDKTMLAGASEKRIAEVFGIIAPPGVTWGGYAESIIKDADFYDALELHGVRDTLQDEYAAEGKAYNATTEGTQCEVDDENPQFFSVYAHLKEGGVECIGDFETYHAAAAYGMEIATKYGWPLYTYSATNGKEETRNDERTVVQWTYFGMSTASLRELVGPNNVRDGVLKNWSQLTSEAKAAIKAKRIEIITEGLKLAHEFDQKDAATRIVEPAQTPAVGVFDITPQGLRTQEHNYKHPDLPARLAEAVELWEKLTLKLHDIQIMTGIPGLHTNINSDDDTPGVLERIQLMQDADENTLEAFRTFDEDAD
jgi:hypothetical protein